MTSTGGYSFAQLAAEQNQKSKDKFGLYRAVDDGNIECVRKILEAGADVNEADSSGFTALHVAARNGNLEVVELLVEHKANVNARLDRGLTPTYLASREGRTNVVEFLALVGADIDLPNNANWKPLFSAAYFGRAAVIETLIYFGVNVNSVDAQRTALSIAVEDRHEEATRALLTLNATIDPTLIESTTRHPELHRLLCQFHEMPTLERERIREEALQRIQHRVASNTMKRVHSNILNVCICLAPLELPPYVLLWIIDWLPFYHLASHRKKIRLIESIVKSIRKIRGESNE